MRHAIVALLAGCGGSTRSAPLVPAGAVHVPAPVAAVEPALPVEAAVPVDPVEAAEPAARVDASPAPPELPTFARAGELYVLSADGGPHCETWTIDPALATLGNTTRLGRKTVTRTIGYRVEGRTLVLDDTHHVAQVGGETVADQTSSDCGVEPMIEADDAVVLASGARWFRTGAACAAAIAHHARVATAMCLPLEPDDAFAEPHQPTRRRFHRLLARGGTVYSIVDGRRGETCKPVRIRAGRDAGAPGRLVGAFTWRVAGPDGERGTASVGYELDPAAEDAPPRPGWIYGPMTLLGYGVTYDDGGGFGTGCANFETPVYRDGVVDMGDSLYLTARACRAAIADQAAAASWMPPEPGDDEPDPDDGVARADGEPGISGC